MCIRDSLDGEGVADHADVGAQAAKLDGVDGFGVVLRHEPAREVERAERGLVEDRGIEQPLDLVERGCELPDVYKRQMTASCR